MLRAPRLGGQTTDLEVFTLTIESITSLWGSSIAIPEENNLMDNSCEQLLATTPEYCHHTQSVFAASNLVGEHWIRSGRPPGIDEGEDPI